MKKNERKRKVKENGEARNMRKYLATTKKWPRRK